MTRFITAEDARTISKSSSSFNGLVETATQAIKAAANSGAWNVNIPYEGVTNEDHTRFHALVKAYGFDGRQASIDNKLVYKVMW